MALETMLLDVDDGVATITLHRPEHRNAMTGEMVDELYQTLGDLARRTDVRVVVLTAAGDRFFCPGADLDLSRADPEQRLGDEPNDARRLHCAVLLHEMPQVTIAAINGACAGAGLGWAAACDLRIASSTAVFNVAFLDIGVAGDMGLPWTLPRLVGAARARELFLLRERFDAGEALAMGLVAEVHPPEQLAAGVARVVARLRAAGPRALRTTKANFVAAERLSFADFVDLETERHLQLVAGAEFRAGIERFLAGRAPKPDGAR